MIRRAFSSRWRQRRRPRPSDRLAGVTLALFVALSALGIFAPVDAAAAEAMAEVKSTVDQVLEILKNPEYKSAAAARRQKLRDVMGVHFDFADMSRSALGVHWKSISQDQRREFVPLFRDLMEALYMSRIESYSGQEIKFLKEKSNNSDYAEVYTSIAQQGAQPIILGGGRVFADFDDLQLGGRAQQHEKHQEKQAACPGASAHPDGTRR